MCITFEFFPALWSRVYCMWLATFQRNLWPLSSFLKTEAITANETTGHHNPKDHNSNFSSLLFTLSFGIISNFCWIWSLALDLPFSKRRNKKSLKRNNYLKLFIVINDCWVKSRCTVIGADWFKTLATSHSLLLLNEYQFLSCLNRRTAFTIPYLTTSTPLTHTHTHIR
jgi:hypothetical protein